MTKNNVHNMDNTRALLSPPEIAEILGLSARHVLDLPIPQIRLGPRTIRYRREDLEAYINSRVARERQDAADDALPWPMDASRRDRRND